jgi:bifunctional UDP-N-acetylglucosamine pyrophosphorylase/glucosamine-1-phosphate N-acetyltransferase
VLGRGAYIAAGSVVTDAVPEDAVAFGRARQTNKDGHARSVRERNAQRAGKKPTTTTTTTTTTTSK